MKVILLKLTQSLIVLTLCVTSIYAQDPIKKPEKKQKVTTTTKPKTRKNNKKNISTEVSEPKGYINGYGFVDLGLRVKWATCNIGASSHSDYGNYYAWGIKSPKHTKKYQNGNIFRSNKVLARSTI